MTSPRRERPDGIERLTDLLADAVDRGELPGLSWAVALGGEVAVGAVGGALDADEARPVERDSIFRISSMTKPVTAVAALILIEDGVIGVDDPVDDLLPELADRQVLAGPTLHDTVPAKRPISVRDLLTFRLGWGMDFTATSPQPTLAAMAEMGLGAGPPAPAGVPEPDEFLRLLGTLPLEHQPGERWLYHVGADVLGVLIARAAGQSFDAFLRDRLFEPLGMRDTGFWVPPEDRDRFGPCFTVDPDTNARATYDPVDGQWASPPAFPSGGHGLVSTVDDYLAFAEMLLNGGSWHDQRIISPASVELMTTNQLTTEQRTTSGPDPSRSLGWGFGVGVQVEPGGPAAPVGRYGWDGGLGSAWANDPNAQLIGILLTNQTWSSPTPPQVFDDFWLTGYAST